MCLSVLASMLCSIIDKFSTFIQGNGKFGWLHFRASLHDPIISLTMESDVKGGVRHILQELINAGFIKGTEEFLDCSAMIQYVRG